MTPLPSTPSKNPLPLIIPAPSQGPSPALDKVCHRFYAPVVFPEADKLVPGKATVTPRLGNFPCVKEACMLWNAEKSECWDVSAARGLALSGEYAYNKMNDVHIQEGGA